jgi:hypothetical protein
LKTKPFDWKLHHGQHDVGFLFLFLGVHVCCVPAAESLGSLGSVGNGTGGIVSIAENAVLLFSMLVLKSNTIYIQGLLSSRAFRMPSSIILVCMVH